jgi:hypothetical protein
VIAKYENAFVLLSVLACASPAGFETVRSFRLDEPIDGRLVSRRGMVAVDLGPRRPLGSDPIVLPS